MLLFSDRLVESIRKAASPFCVGLDPRIERMPAFIKSGRQPTPDAIRSVISDFHELVIDAIAGLAPIVKLQLAFFEQYGSHGIQAFEDTVRIAKQRRLLVIADGKRNDVDSTAEAYAAAFLGEIEIFGEKRRAFDVDAMTITPYLGRDSMLPFVKACHEFAKGMFVVLKTSNPGSRDYQDQPLQNTGQPLYTCIAQTVRDFGEDPVGQSGYSSIRCCGGRHVPH